MNKLYSWLQKEDNGVKISELYWREEFYKYKVHDRKEEIDAWIFSMVTSPSWLASLKKNVDIVYLDSSFFSHIHAQYNPNTNQIEIYNDWIDAYSTFMDKELAIQLHSYHELYHIYEEENYVPYENLKYRQKNFLSEYCALEISRSLCELPWACAVYDLCATTKDEEEAVRQLERRLNDEAIN